MGNSKLSIEGIECWSYHGCLTEELKIGGMFSVDVILEMDIKKAIENDDLSNTADYTLVHDIVRKEMDIPSKLIESVAGRILMRIAAAFPRAVNIIVRVIKYNPPVNGKIGRAVIEISL